MQLDRIVLGHTGWFLPYMLIVPCFSSWGFSPVLQEITSLLRALWRCWLFKAPRGKAQPLRDESPWVNNLYFPIPQRENSEMCSTWSSREFLACWFTVDFLAHWCTFYGLFSLLSYFLHCLTWTSWYSCKEATDIQVLVSGATFGGGGSEGGARGQKLRGEMIL